MNTGFEDVFGNIFTGILDNISKVFTNVAGVLNVVKIVIEQKGFKGTGLNASVNVNKNKLSLMM